VFNLDRFSPKQRREDGFPGMLTGFRGRLGLKIGLVAWMALALLSAAASAERMSVKADKANIRSGPGTSGYDILWEVERYHPLEVLQKQDGWVYFRDFEGDKGWIYGDLLGKEATVITRTDLVNIRSGPGTNHDIVFKAEKGVPFRVLGEQGDWLHIESRNGDKGYIHKKLVW
jgi:SH3-like domain-containing protein